MIGVLMSATLPARLGEPSRAFIVARRLGRVRDRFPVVLGTIVSQTILNLVALVILGSVMLATVGLFRGGVDNLVIATVAPVVVIALLLATPAVLRRRRASRFQRVQQAVAGRAPRDGRRAPRAGGLPTPQARRLGGGEPAGGLGPAVAGLSTCCWWRSASTSRPAWAPPRRSCSP